MESPIRFGAVVRQSKKNGRFWMYLPATIADTFKEEGIAVYEQEKGLLVGYSELWYDILAKRLSRFAERHDIFWMQKLMDRRDAYPLLMNCTTEQIPIKGRQKIWLPQKFAPEKTCAAVVSIIDNKRFSIEYLL